MNILFITIFVVGFMVFEIPRVSVFGYFPLYIYIYIYRYIGCPVIYIYIYIYIEYNTNSGYKWTPKMSYN